MLIFKRSGHHVVKDLYSCNLSRFWWRGYDKVCDIITSKGNENVIFSNGQRPLKYGWAGGGLGCNTPKILGRCEE